MLGSNSATDGNNAPGQFTKAQIAAYANASASNFISWAVQRNPTATYKYIQQNYPGMFIKVVPPLEQSVPQQQSMHQFLLKQYRILPGNQQAHFLYTIGASLPATPDISNWTTPSN